MLPNVGSTQVAFTKLGFRRAFLLTFALLPDLTDSVLAQKPFLFAVTPGGNALTAQMQTKTPFSPNVRSQASLLYESSMNETGLLFEWGRFPHFTKLLA